MGEFTRKFKPLRADVYISNMPDWQLDEPGTGLPAGYGEGTSGYSGVIYTMSKGYRGQHAWSGYSGYSDMVLDFQADFSSPDLSGWTLTRNAAIIPAPYGFTGHVLRLIGDNGTASLGVSATNQILLNMSVYIPPLHGFGSLVGFQYNGVTLGKFGIGNYDGNAIFTFSVGDTGQVLAQSKPYPLSEVYSLAVMYSPGQSGNATLLVNGKQVFNFTGSTSTPGHTSVNSFYFGSDGNDVASWSNIGRVSVYVAPPVVPINYSLGIITKFYPQVESSVPPVMVKDKCDLTINNVLYTNVPIAKPIPQAYINTWVNFPLQPGFWQQAGQTQGDGSIARSAYWFCVDDEVKVEMSNGSPVKVYDFYTSQPNRRPLDVIHMINSPYWVNYTKTAGVFDPDNSNQSDPLDNDPPYLSTLDSSQWWLNNAGDASIGPDGQTLLFPNTARMFTDRVDLVTDAPNIITFMRTVFVEVGPILWIARLLGGLFYNFSPGNEEFPSTEEWSRYQDNPIWVWSAPSSKALLESVEADVEAQNAVMDIRNVQQQSQYPPPQPPAPAGFTEETASEANNWFYDGFTFAGWPGEIPGNIDYTKFMVKVSGPVHAIGSELATTTVVPSKFLPPDY